MRPVREGSKTPIAALVALTIALGLAACGGDSGSTAGEAADGGQSQGKNSGSSATQGSGKGASGKSKSDGGDQSSDSGSRAEEAADFTPKKHRDSGGGSKQFRIQGGDNSVQEFGKEADTQEFEAAAVALHNFLDARAEGNWAAACGYMSKAVIESFEKLAAQAKQLDDTSCAGILEKLTNPGARAALKAEAQKADAGSLRVEGDRSFVIYTGLEGTIMAMSMDNEDGEWKVASLAATPLN